MVLSGTDQESMNAPSIGCSDGTSTPTLQPRFEVSLAYQDLPTGLHARQFLNHVLDHCQLAGEFSLTLWRLELFHLPEVCEQAVTAACDAALVLLSLRGDIGLEPVTENWLKQWIDRRRDDEGALAVLIDCDMQRLDSMGQTLFRLQDLTRLSQVRLFVGFIPAAPVPAAEASSWKPESGHTETLLLPHDKISHPLELSREGGINE
jgi:hypothetical protein